MADLLTRVQTLESELAEKEQALHKDEGRLAALKESLKKICGTDDEQKAQQKLSSFMEEKEEKEQALEALLDKIERLTTCND